MRHVLSILTLVTVMLCTTFISRAAVISDNTITSVINEITATHPNVDKALLQRGVCQVASLWQTQDGNEEVFAQFVKDNYAANADQRKELFDKLSKAFEVLKGTSNQVAVELGLPTVLAGPDPTNIDYIMSAFNPYSHLWSDLYENKVAFITMLNSVKKASSLHL